MVEGLREILAEVGVMVVLDQQPVEVVTRFGVRKPLMWKKLSDMQPDEVVYHLARFAQDGKISLCFCHAHNSNVSQGLDPYHNYLFRIVCCGMSFQILCVVMIQMVIRPLICQ